MAKREAEADDYARRSQAEGVFDVRDQRIYLLTPNHRMTEYSISDLIDDDELTDEG